MKDMYDVIIIGGGPAGLSAAIYAGRAERKTLVIEKGSYGGRVKDTLEIRNYPGTVDVYKRQVLYCLCTIYLNPA